MKHLTHFLALGLALGCSGAEGAFHPSAIGSTIAEGLRQDSGAVVSLDSLGPAEWTSMFVFGPYAPPELMRRCVQTSARMEMYGLDRRDDIVAIYFKRPNGQLSSVAFPRDQAPFASDAMNLEYPRGSATFMVRAKGALKELTPRGALTRSCS